MTRILLPLLGLLLAGGATAQTGHIRSVTLERQPCYGTCPWYTLTLNADGTAVYRGERFVSRIGTYQGTFWRGDIDRLRRLLDSSGFWRMKPEYAARMTDQPTQIVTVVTERGTRRVRQYGAEGPDGLWAVQTAIDGIAANARDWKKAK